MAGITGYLIAGCMVDSDGARVRSSYPEVHRCLLCCPCTSYHLSLPAVLPMYFASAARVHRAIHHCPLCCPCTSHGLPVHIASSTTARCAAHVHRIGCPCTSRHPPLPAVLPMYIASAARAHRIIHRRLLCSTGREGLLWGQRRAIRGDSSDFQPPMCRSRILGMRSCCCWHDISVKCRCYLVRQWILCTRLRIVMLLAISISGSGH